MDIVEFFQQSTGKWSSLRTSHNLAVKQQEGGRSDIVIEMLDQSDPEVTKLCELYKVDPTSALCGVRITWNGTMEWDQAKHSGSTVLVPLSAATPNEGQLLRNIGYAEKSPVSGRYLMNGEELTLTTESESMSSKERFWFESPNVRLRHTVLKRSGGFSMTSFCSEIRMGVANPPEKAADQATTPALQNEGMK